MAKEFKTIDQLVELMEGCGIVADNRTAVRCFIRLLTGGIY